MEKTPVSHALSPQIVALKMPLPKVLYRWFDVPQNQPNRSIILLYRTVLLDAFYDLAKNCPQANDWLLTPSADLAEVTDYAHVTMGQIHRIAEGIKAKNIKLPPWRIWRYTWADLS